MPLPLPLLGGTGMTAALRLWPSLKLAVGCALGAASPSSEAWILPTAPAQHARVHVPAPQRQGDREGLRGVAGSRERCHVPCAAAGTRGTPAWTAGGLCLRGWQQQAGATTWLWPRQLPVAAWLQGSGLGLTVRQPDVEVEGRHVGHLAGDQLAEGGLIQAAPGRGPHLGRQRDAHQQPAACARRCSRRLQRGTPPGRAADPLAAARCRGRRRLA